MSRISTSQRILLTVLLVAGLAWAIDTFIGTDGPRSAQGAAAAAANSPNPPVNWDEITVLVTRLTQHSSGPVITELSPLQRDLFLPTPQLNTLAAALPTPPPSSAPAGLAAAEEEGPGPEPDFGSQHELVGVIIGRRALAVVDNRLLPRGACLDGYELVEIQRDYVVFRHEQTQACVTLKLKQPGARP